MLTFALIILWIAGIVWFVNSLSDPTDSNPSETEDKTINDNTQWID